MRHVALWLFGAGFLIIGVLGVFLIIMYHGIKSLSMAVWERI